MARREEREATESAAADMLRRSARVLRTLEEACVRARAAPSTAILYVWWFSVLSFMCGGVALLI